MSVVTYADWKAPKEDGQSLIWPAPAELLRQTRENQRRLSSAACLVQNVPLGELRKRTRQWIGHEDEKPLIATGHQTELHHPGVWVKNAMINAVAKVLNGEAYHLAVDTDEPKHLHLRWPMSADAAITDDPNLSSAAWAALVDPPSPGHVQDIQRAVGSDASSWPFVPMLGDFFGAMRRSVLEPAPLPNVLTAALHELDWSLGLRHHALLASPIWQSEHFLIFVHHVLARAGEFAAHYNRALKEYRNENDITSPGRPMPDLVMNGDSIEVPFWLDDLRVGGRCRMTIAKNSLRIGDEEFVFSRSIAAEDAGQALLKFLRRHGARISPRALTLTMFARLLMADQFVHGIGGGRYDHVTDRIIRSFFGIEPPGFSVTTATLYFPTAVGRSRACVPCVLQEGHHLKHSLLGARKQAMLATIAASPRYSTQRRNVFMQMRRELDELEGQSPQINEWQRRLSETRTREAEEKVLFDRELFYAIQPHERLQKLIEEQISAFAR